MSGPLTWWANRKSRLGMSPVAKEPPPIAPGRAWWTSPPIAPPQPEHIEYVVQYQRQLISTRTMRKRDRDAMLKYVADWLTEARRLLHQHMVAPHRADLQSMDGLILAASTAMGKLRGHVGKLGGVIDDPSIEEVLNVLRGRADEIRRKRAMRQDAP